MAEAKTYRRGEIYYADLGNSFGCEQGGVRPVLVIQNNTGNRHAPTVTVIPLTSKIKKEHQPTHYILTHGMRRTSMVMAEQPMTIDKRKLGSYLTTLNKKQMDGVSRALCVQLGLDKNG